MCSHGLVAECQIYQELSMCNVRCWPRGAKNFSYATGFTALSQATSQISIFFMKNKSLLTFNSTRAQKIVIT